MFKNDVHIRSTADDPVLISTIISTGDRKSTRVFGSGAEQSVLTISHNESNENPGFVTTRSNVRVSKDFVLDGSDRTVTGYVQFTMSLPKEQVSVDEARKIAGYLLTFLVYGENAADAGIVTVPNDLAPGFDRLYAGEP
jgi:hypothetical protein